ncbi:MAG: SUMF1/EgtB/PvdO family nonheme iron enzyme [Chloroflexi bacterium]|nr:SUMF1/EgtB/PvdO family nonheme iron enzyme [Chloroflexota bacterium]
MAETPDPALNAKLALLGQMYEDGGIDETTYRAQLTKLGIDPDSVLSPPPPIFGQQRQTVGTQINIAGNMYGPLPVLSPPPDPADALGCYLARVIEENARLQLQGIRSATGLVSIDLEEVYITLTATVRKAVGEQEAWVEEMARLAPGEARRRGAMRESVAQVQVQVQEALRMHERLVVLGDPGCGKTTLLKYLALTYARDLSSPPVGGTEGQSGVVRERLQLDERRLPVLLPLRDLARYLEKECPNVGADGPRLLLDYLRLYLANQQMALPADFFQVRLAAGECAVLLDGVDEVASMATRQRVARIVERFTLAYPDNRYVVTSRIVGYSGGAQLSAGYAVTRVRDFGDDDIARFARHWNRAVEVVLAGGATDYALRKAEAEADKLIRAIRDSERVRELAVNPLLLTVIALVQRYRAQLPDRRVELYEEALEVLLAQWDAVKGLPSTEVLQGLELDAGDRRSLLEPVALWMMEQRVREIELDDLRARLCEPFVSLLKDERLANKAVEGFVGLINARSGLLTERGQGIYAFSHLTFQEHLAARAVADREDYIACTLARLGDSWWREVVLLEAGYLSTQGKRRATELIRAMMAHEKEPEPHHNLVLAAEAVRDVGQARIEGDLAGEIQARLRAAFETPLKKGGDLAAQVQRRAAAAEALGRIESGSYGAQPAFWTLPWGIPLWVEIPAGAFWMGSQEGDADERPVHQVHLDTFWISRVPITHAQYRFFVEDAGRGAPEGWQNGRPPKGRESHPVVKVSWHDARAYCHWLADKMRVGGYALRVWQPEGAVTRLLAGVPLRVELPSEAEWEMAARGPRPAPARGEGSGEGVGGTIHGGRGRKGIAIRTNWAWAARRRWAFSRRGPALTAAWTWPATCGSGRGACGAETGRSPISSIPTRRRTGGRTSSLTIPTPG